MIQELILKGLRKVYRGIVHPDFTGNRWPQSDEWEHTNNYLAELFSRDQPCFVGRIGTTEGAIVLNYLTVHSDKSYLRKCYEFITDATRLPFYETGKPFRNLQICSGFFSDNGVGIKEVERFAELYLREIPTMDVCGRVSLYRKIPAVQP